jgi:hypothetical protein
MDKNSENWFNNSLIGSMKDNKLNQAFINILNKLEITSIKELSELSGLDQATISRHIHRKQPLSHEHMVAYAQALDLNVGKFADDEIPTYIIVGSVNLKDGIVSARGEEEAQKIMFHNEYGKIKGAKMLLDTHSDQVLRYKTSDKSKIGNYCFVKYNKPYLHGIVGIVQKVTPNSCEVLIFNGKTVIVKDYVEIYPITSQHNIRHNSGTVVKVEF